MRRIVIVGVLVGVGVLTVRAHLPKLHERLVARCETMFERMPDTFPPKKMMRGIAEIRANTERILELLEADKQSAETSRTVDPTSAEGVHDAA
jgi:hypothetical protein